MKLLYKKRESQMVKFNDYKRFWNRYFKNSSNENFANITVLSYNNLEEIVLNKLSFHVSFKEEWFGKTVGLYKHANSQSYNDKV